MKRGNKPYSVTFESLVMRLVKQVVNFTFYLALLRNKTLVIRSHLEPV